MISRRKLLAAIGVGGFAVLGRMALPHLLAVPDPQPLDAELKDFVDTTLGGIDRAKIWDVHCHVFGTGTGGTGCRIHPRVTSHLNVIERARLDVFLAAAGTDLGEDADARYIERLLDLQVLANPRGRIVCLAFDHVVHEDGREDRTVVPFHTPSEYVLDLAARHRQIEAGVSIHPYRLDAVERLERAAAAGARLVKWLPATMGIDPASPLCDPFYEKLAALGIPLLTHAGGESAVSVVQEAFGNPLRLRRPLEAGVRVIVAHCASTGDDEDIDLPAGRRARVPSFDLFMRLMAEPEHERRLLGDISAITQVNRSGRPLATLLAADELHHRLLDGSDYPLPAVDPLVSTRWLECKGYIDARERALCNRVYARNPLLFDRVLKACLRTNDRGRAARFSPVVFETAWAFG